MAAVTSYSKEKKIALKGSEGIQHHINRDFTFSRTIIYKVMCRVRPKIRPGSMEAALGRGAFTKSVFMEWVLSAQMCDHQIC